MSSVIDFLKDFCSDALKNDPTFISCSDYEFHEEDDHKWKDYYTLLVEDKNNKKYVFGLKSSPIEKQGVNITASIKEQSENDRPITNFSGNVDAMLATLPAACATIMSHGILDVVRSYVASTPTEK